MNCFLDYILLVTSQHPRKRIERNTFKLIKAVQGRGERFNRASVAPSFKAK
jgi:hypothetical protein